MGSSNGAPKLPAEIRRALARLERDVAALNLLASDDSRTFPELALLLARLDRSGDKPGLSQQLASVRDFVRSRAAHSYPPASHQEVVIGAGVLELCRIGKTTRWEGVRLAARLAARVADEAVDRETGETLPLGVLCERTAAVIVDCAGLDAASKAWRKTSVERYGLDPSEFAESSGGTLSIRFVD